MPGKYQPLHGRKIASDFFGYGKENFPPFKRLKFNLRAAAGYRKADRLLAETLRRKECFFGPFKGEFGHFLGHNLPFLSFLHREGVKIHYCGLEMQKILLVTEKNEEIVHTFFPLRDFFHEVEPNTNETIPPADVESRIAEFAKTAVKSGLPFWNLSDPFWYWFCFRTWIFCRPVMHRYDLSKVFGTTKENSAVIFPRRKGETSTPNNGEEWDYQALAETISPLFDKIYMCGHPALSQNVKETGKIVSALHGDNSEILRHCSNTRVILSQHSGTVYLGAYTGCRVLVLYQPKRKILGMEDTLVFNSFLNPGFRFDFAWSPDEAERYCRMLLNCDEFSKPDGFIYSY